MKEHIPLVFMESQGISQCIEIGKMSFEEASFAEPKIEGVETLDPNEKLGCIKRVGFEQGIPLHKIRVFHFWQGMRHPLRSKQFDNRVRMEC